MSDKFNNNDMVYTLVNYDGQPDVEGDLLSIVMWFRYPPARATFLRKALDWLTWNDRTEVAALVCRVKGEELFVLTPEMTRLFLCQLLLLQ